MLQKLKSEIKQQTKLGSTLEFLSGLIIFFVVLTIAYFVGNRDGLPEAKIITSNINQIQTKLDNLQKAVDKNQPCASDLPVAVPNKLVK
jgi:hypothetical protein